MCLTYLFKLSLSGLRLAKIEDGSMDTIDNVLIMKDIQERCRNHGQPLITFTILTPLADHGL